MSIRARTIISLLVTMIALTILLYFALCHIVGGGFTVVERSAADRDIERVRETFASDIEALCAKVADWGTWDDAYQFVVDRNQEFVQSNIAPSAMSDMGLAALIFFNKKGEVVIGTGYDAENDTLAPVPAAVLSGHFGKDSPLIRHDKNDSEHSGLLFTAGSAPLVFCSKPVIPTSGEGEVRGAVVFARWFDRSAHEALMRTTKLKLAFGAEDGQGIQEPVAPIRQKLPDPSSRFIDDSDRQILVGYTRLDDFYGRKSLIARVEMPRQILSQAEASCRYVALALVVFGLVFIGVTTLLVENAVLRRLAKLKADVTRITENFDFESRVDGEAKDELGRLGLCINRLLAAVAQIQHARGESGKTTPDPGEEAHG